MGCNWIWLRIIIFAWRIPAGNPITESFLESLIAVNQGQIWLRGWNIIVGNSWVSPGEVYPLLMTLTRSLENTFPQTTEWTTGSLKKVSVSRVTGSSRYLSSGSFWIIYFIHINSTYSLKLILNHSLNHIRLRESWWLWCCPDHCASSNNIPFSLFEANQKGDLGFFLSSPA